MAAVIIGGAIATVVYQDRLVDLFISEINKSLNTPISAGTPEISWFEEFPQVAIVFPDVEVQESFTFSERPLLTAEKVSIVFNPIQLLRQDFNIHHVTVSGADLNLVINNEGVSNFRVIDSREERPDSARVSLEIRKLELSDVNLTFNNERRDQFQSYEIDELTSRIAFEPGKVVFTVSSDFQTNEMRFRSQKVLENKDIQLTGDLVYVTDSGRYDINLPELVINDSGYGVKGSYWTNPERIDLRFEGINSSIQSVLAILPEKVAAPLLKVRSEGKVSFEADLKGDISGGKTPSLKVTMDFDDVDISHPDYNQELTDASFTAVLSSTELGELNKFKLEVENLNAAIDNHPVFGRFELNDFTKFNVNGDLKGKVLLPSIEQFLKQDNIDINDGEAVFSLAIKGSLLNVSTIRSLDADGEITLEKMDIEFGESIPALKDARGKLNFNNNDILITDFEGAFGESDFMITGQFKNLIPYLLYDDQPIGITASLESQYLNLEELLLSNPGSGEEEDSNLIYPGLQLIFQCDIDRLKFKRFEGEEVKGEVRIRDQLVFARNLGVDAMGGKVLMSGVVDGSNPSNVKIETNSEVIDINIEEAFYVFENFNQTWLIDENLRGKLTTDVTAEMALDKNLKLKPESLIADIDMRIRNGELNDFEPVQRLSKYVGEQDLSHLVFSDLENDVHIEGQTIYLPEMEVRSNVSEIRISGTHTFRQEIDYRIVAPLRSKKKVDKDEAFGAIVEDRYGKSRVYLKIVGTTDDYVVAYDIQGVKQKILSDIKKEVQELKDAFKNKGQEEKKIIELSEDEYFEWDEEVETDSLSRIRRH